MIMNDAIDAAQTNYGKEHAFKIALVNEFGCETFNEFVFDLKRRVEQTSHYAAHVAIYGHDSYDNKFAFYITSLETEETGERVIVGISYKWDKSSDKASNWHETQLLMHNYTYPG